MKKYLIAILFLVLPTVVVKYMLRIFLIKTHSVAKGAKVGFSLVLCDELKLGENATIGHLNYIRIKSLVLKEKARIRHLNILNGPISVAFDERAWIHSQNKISGPVLGFEREQIFYLGKGSQVMLKCLFDITSSIHIGNNTTIAGSDVQMWTHGFYVGKHSSARVDGNVFVGDDCYIGARVVVCSGVKIADSTSIGANSTVSKSITMSGLYVSQPLRYIEYDADKIISNLSNEVAPKVFEKSPS